MTRASPREGGRARTLTPLASVIALLLVVTLLRASGLLGPPSLRWALPLGFVLMASSPWLLMHRDGRRLIGLVASRSMRHLLLGVAVGVAASLACGLAGSLLFGSGADNWFVSVAEYYRASVDVRRFAPVELFAILTVPAVLFSPVGEEVFFRGLLQRSLSDRVGVTLGTLLACSAFGAVHLLHHGLSRSNGALQLRPVSGALWIMLMAAVAWSFTWLRARSGSLYPPMAAHAAFNITMNAYIFTVLW